MSTPLPYLGVVTAAAAANVRLVLGAMGLGFGGFGVPMVAQGDEEATPESEPTGFMQYDGSADSELVAALQSLVAGVAPAIDGFGSTIAWGEDGLIAEADAVAAFGGESVQIISAAGVAAGDLQAWRNANIDALGYRMRPAAS